ncbi:hypothetical protein E2C01_030747 [Portunus trituberculatus]|uniref:RNA-directed DNA polymerase from mobile element jockey n=1 Tax=Portunus trituberculatus TaxID=210409 RepID=A0A5B7ESQ8_PORTR|nr:hypothetical protein [Portunus trituberculatus]
MTVPYPTKLPPSLPVVAGLTAITTNEGEVRAAFTPLEENKAVGPDGVSPRLLSRCSGEEQAVTARLNTTLRRLEDWERRWQVTFAPQKIQLLVVSRSEHDIRPTFNGAQVTPQPELQILGVTFDSKLTYQTHIRQLA